MILRRMDGYGVELQQVGVVRGGREILREVSLRVAGGTCCAVLGPNGSGKSTLLSVLSGYTWPTRGGVTIGGQSFGEVDVQQIRRRIGLIEPSRTPPFDESMSVREVVATGLFGTIVLPFHRPVERGQWRRVDAELASLGLAALGQAAFGRLSTGERMKALLARAMVGEAKLLLLDEPTAGLDMGARAACVGLLDRLLNRNPHPTVVIISHHLDELPRGVDRVVLLKDGRIAADGLPCEVLTSERLSRLFDCRVEVFNHDGRYVASVRDE